METGEVTSQRDNLQINICLPVKKFTLRGILYGNSMFNEKYYYKKYTLSLHLSFAAVRLQYL